VNGRILRLGFVPLVDAAALIVARERGFFAAQGVEVELSREVSWATVRDKVMVGALDGAHMLAPLALAATLGAGSDPVPLIAPLALNLDGAAVTLSTRLGGALVGGAEGLARLVARRRDEGASPLTFAVVYPYSIHNYLLRDWMAGAGLDPDRDVRLTVAPPSRMAELLGAGVIEGFCAGEPWNSVAVAAGAGQVVARASQVWGRSPDKVFGLTQAWAEAHPADLAAILRALIAAAAWGETPGHRDELVNLLARPDYLGVGPELIAAGLDDIVFSRDGAGLPRLSDAKWLVEQMVRWGQIPADLDAAAIAAQVYRPDLYEVALGG
jgi:ABC-type nitrate/sulfonate/bicarbonate transport system substrate-binding protein